MRKEVQEEKNVPFIFQFKKDVDGTLENLEKALNTGSPETLPSPID